MLKYTFKRLKPITKWLNQYIYNHSYNKITKPSEKILNVHISKKKKIVVYKIGTEYLARDNLQIKFSNVFFELIKFKEDKRFELVNSIIIMKRNR